MAEWFPERERALAWGIFNSGSSSARSSLLPSSPGSCSPRGWPAAFLATGITGLVWLAVWWPVYRTPAAVANEPEPVKIPFRKLFRQRFVWSLTLAKVFFDPVWYFYIFWFPEYLKHARDFSMASIGKYGWDPVPRSRRRQLARRLDLRRAHPSRLLHYCRPKIDLHLVHAAHVVGHPRRAHAGCPQFFSIALVSLAMIGYTGALANMLAFPSDIYPKHLVGSVWGLASMGAGFGGMIFALITGWVVDHYSYTPVFIGFGLLPLISSASSGCSAGP